MEHRIIELLEEALSLLREANTPTDDILWGNRVSAVFKDRVKWIADDLGFDVNWLMACMAFESAETFSPSIGNLAGSGAVGLIQFMPNTAKGLGTTTQALAKMTAEDQLKYVYKYFEPYRERLKSLEDVYMAILWPSAVGKPMDYDLFVRGGVAYRQNAGLDVNKDGYIKKSEAAAKVREKLTRGESFRG